MKQISLIILIFLAAFNQSRPMAKTKMAAKPSAAMAVANAKLQAKPILFFNVDSIQDIYNEKCVFDGPELCHYESILVTSGRSLEIKDIRKESQKLGDLYNNSHEALEKNKIIYEMDLKNKEIDAVYKKVQVIMQEIAKKKDAAAVLSFSGTPKSGTIEYIDAAYDITEEVIDTLNKEYKESQSKKHACMHCCHAHCPKTY